MPQTMTDLAEKTPELIIPGHCTGFRAIHKLIDTFGEGRVVPCAVGRTYASAGGPRGREIFPFLPLRQSRYYFATVPRLEIF